MRTASAIIRLILCVLALIGVCHLGNRYFDPTMAPAINVALCVIVLLLAMGSFIIDEDRIEALEGEIRGMYEVKMTRMSSYTPRPKLQPAPPLKVNGAVIDFAKKDSDEPH